MRLILKRDPHDKYFAHLYLITEDRHNFLATFHNDNIWDIFGEAIAKSVNAGNELSMRMEVEDE